MKKWNHELIAGTGAVIAAAVLGFNLHRPAYTGPTVPCWNVSQTVARDMFGATTNEYLTRSEPVILGSFANFTDATGQQYALAGSVVITKERCGIDAPAEAQAAEAGQ